MMSKASTTIVFNGQAIKTGSMDVRDLAPALLSFGKVCERAHAVVNGKETGMSVHVHGFKAGSFGIDLSIVQTSLEHMNTLFGSQEYATAKELLTLLIGGGGVSVYGLIKWLKGRKPNQITVKDEEVTLTLDDEPEPITIPKKKYQLITDPELNKHLYESLSPLKREGVDNCEFRQESEVLERVEKDDLTYFSPTTETTLEETEQWIILQVDTAQITDVRNKWRFSTLGKSRLKITAQITDQDYLKKVEEGAVLFKHGNRINALLVTKTSFVNGSERVQYEIKKVEGAPQDPELF